MKMLRKKSLLALLLSLCMVVGILPATVFAAGAGMPQNIRWAESPKSMVQWDAPSGGGQYQYELRLKLGETIIDGPDLTVQRYHLFNGSLMTEARENYTVEIRARSCIIVGEFPNEYVTSPGEWGDWATLEGSGGGEGPTPPHEHSFGGWKNNGTQHWKECSCGEKSEESPHNFGEWELIYYDVNTKYDVCERQCLTCGYEQIDRYREHQHYYTDDWSSGSTTHWKVCYYCKEVNQDTVANHTFGDWTETKPATTTEEGLKERTCSVCEYTQTETLPVHTHDVHDKAWKYDETEHWQECSCGEKLNVANHAYGEWRVTKPATETEEGSKARDCTVCDHVQTEIIPMLEHEHSYGDWQKDKTQHWKECRCGKKTEVGNILNYARKDSITIDEHDRDLFFWFTVGEVGEPEVVEQIDITGPEDLVGLLGQETDRLSSEQLGSLSLKVLTHISKASIIKCLTNKWHFLSEDKSFYTIYTNLYSNPPKNYTNL